MTERHVVKYLAELALACWQKRAHCPKVPLRTSLHIIRNCRARRAQPTRGTAGGWGFGVGGPRAAKGASLRKISCSSAATAP